MMSPLLIPLQPGDIQIEKRAGTGFGGVSPPYAIGNWLRAMKAFKIVFGLNVFSAELTWKWTDPDQTGDGNLPGFNPGSIGSVLAGSAQPDSAFYRRQISGDVPINCLMNEGANGANMTFQNFNRALIYQSSGDNKYYVGSNLSFAADAGEVPNEWSVTLVDNGGGPIGEFKFLDSSIPLYGDGGGDPAGDVEITATEWWGIDTP